MFRPLSARALLRALVLASSLALALVAPSFASADQAPIAAYSFDEGEGTTVEDLSGNEHTATIHGATWTRGRYGDALQFSAEGDHVTIPGTEDLQFTDGEGFTLEAWVKPENEHEYSPVFTQEDEGHASEEEPYAYTLMARGGSVPTAWIREGGVKHGYEGIYGTEEMPVNSWSHLALTDDGAVIRLYVDGNLVRTAPSPPISPSTGPLQLGGEMALGNQFYGKIDEVRVYNRALEGGEVAGDHSAPLLTEQEGPVAAYAFDEGEGETVEDLSGGEHTATLEGATWSKGKYGNSLNFNGESSCAAVEATPELQPTEEFTIEAWVRPLESGSAAEPVIALRDPSAGEGEEPYAYELLAGGEESPKAWARKGGEGGYDGVYGVVPLDEAAWSHLALTDDGAHLRLYIDGNLVDTAPAPEHLEAAAGPLTLGCGAFGAHFSGRIDEVRIYNRALEGGEVVTDRVTPLLTEREAPVAAYAFDDEEEGETAEDFTGNEHTATLEGATWAKGKYGNSLNFNGESSCAAVEATPELQPTEEFTLEAWVRPLESGSEAEPVIALRDPSASEGEEPYAYELLAGGEEAPKAWARKGGEGGYDGVYGIAPLDEAAWTHLALTDDGAHLRLYVDGEEVASAKAPPHLEAAAGPLDIGCGAFGAHFSGRIDEVRIYNRALEGGEVGGDRSTPLLTEREGPVAAYAFDEGEGTAARDVTENGHEATIEGATWTRGKYGDALDFSASEEDIVTIPTSEDLNLEEFTLEAWVKPAELHTFTPVITKAGEEGYGYELEAGGDEEPATPEGILTHNGSEYRYAFTNEPLPQNSWTHIALTNDGTKLRLYVDGQLVDVHADDKLAGGEAPLQIGGQNSIAPAQYFDGKIDEVRIYNRALELNEIQTDRATPIQTPQAEPIAAYSFDEGEGTTVEDLSGNEHTATIHGATWTRGRYGDALQFSAEGDHVTIPGTEDLQFTDGEGFTLEAWVKPENEHEYSPVFTQEDEGHASEEEPYAYTLMARGGSVPTAWIREGGVKHGYEGIYGTEEMPVNSWSHLALTDDGAVIRLYVDGNLVRTAPSPPISPSTGPLQLGGEMALGNQFYGKIDEVRVYNRALEGGEVDAADKAPPTRPKGFIAVYEQGPTVVMWDPSVDPAGPDEKPGSGVREYQYRFKLEAEPTWSQWEKSANPDFLVEASAGEHISVQAYAVDRAKNSSPVAFGSVVVSESPITPEDFGAIAPTDSGTVDIDPEPPANEEERTGPFSQSSRPGGVSLLGAGSAERLCAGTGENPCGHYVGLGAANYARKWSLNGENDSEARENHNPNFAYKGGGGGDCTNFVSQALHAGGMLFMRANGRNEAKAYNSEEGLFYLDYEHGQGAWWANYWDSPLGGFIHRERDFTKAWAGALGLYEHLTEYHLGHILKPSEPIHLGDVIFYSEGGELKPEDISHTQIVSRYTTGVNGDIALEVAQHSKNYERSLAWVIFKLHKQHQDLGKDYELYFFRPEYAAANIE